MQKQILSFVLLSAAALPFVAVADTWDKKTTLTVNETILVPGKELPPGTYIMKLANVTANRNVVQIFNEDQDELQATILAFPNRRVEAADETVLTYWETPAGTPPALRAWFFPGDNVGQEFAYPKEIADRIAKANNNVQVRSYEGGALTEKQASEIAVNMPDGKVDMPTATSQRTATPEANTTTADARSANRNDENVLLAQNEPRPTARPQDAAEPAAAPQTTQNAEPAANQVNQNQVSQADQALTDEPSELPQTASPVPWVLMAGFAAMIGAIFVRRMAA